MYKYQKLRGRIIEKYGSIGAFADAVGITPTWMSKKLQCKTGITQEDIVLWSKLLEIKPDEYGDFYFA